MKKEKYIYNPHTLSYERHEVSDKAKYLRIFALVSGVLVVMVTGGILGGQFFPSSRERQLKQDLSQVKFQHELVNEKVKDIEQIVDKMHRRDNQLYRRRATCLL